MGFSFRMISAGMKLLKMWRSFWCVKSTVSSSDEGNQCCYYIHVSAGIEEPGLSALTYNADTMVEQRNAYLLHSRCFCFIRGQSPSPRSFFLRLTPTVSMHFANAQNSVHPAAPDSTGGACVCPFIASETFHRWCYLEVECIFRRYTHHFKR